MSSITSIDDEKMKKFLILHPLLQIFLNLKFKTIRWQFRLLFLFQIVLTIALTLIGVQYLQFTSCKGIESRQPLTVKYTTPIHATETVGVTL